METEKGASWRSAWLRFAAGYLAMLAPAHLVWEVLQLPLYTIFRERGAGQIAYAVLHCTAGDVLIGGSSLASGILFVGRGGVPSSRVVYLRVAATTIILAVAYTFFSEWFNTAVRGNWSYAPQMPVIPLVGIGLTPVLQWTIVPALVFWWRRPRHRSD